MKPILPIFAFVLFTSASALHADPVSRNLVERALQLAGRETLERAAREAAELAAQSAVRKLGREGAEQAIERGGLELLEAGARHGDEIWSLATRVPESARYLGARPAEAIALARRLGDDALRLESRAPGLAQTAVQQFGRDSLKSLAKASPDEVSRLLGYASHADSPTTRRALFDLWRRRGAQVLKELDKHKTLILATGLTVSMLDVAHGVSKGAEEGLKKLPEAAPQAVERLADKLGGGASNFATITGVGVAAALLLAISLHFRRRHRSSI